MKRFIKSIVAVVMAVCVIIGLSVFSSSERVNAQNEVKPSLTIKNTTAFELKNVKVQLNKKQTIELGTLEKGESVNVPISEDTEPIVLTKIEGQAAQSGNFVASVSGWVKGGTKMQLCLDEDISYGKSIINLSAVNA